MEAGKRLRLRKYPYAASQVNFRGRGRFLPLYENRWASYNNTAPEPVTSSDSCYKAPVDEPETQLSVPIGQLQVPQDPEGSLLQAFRAELAKIITPTNQNPGKSPTLSMEPKPEGYGSQGVPVSTHATLTLPRDVSTTKLVLQAINSICSNVTTLNSQLRHQVQDGILGSCLEFCTETDRVIQETLHKEPDSDVSAGEPVQQTDADLLINGVQCLRKVITEFERLRDRLLTAESMKPRGDYNNGLTYLVIDPVCKGD